jgi:hypothetical protein
MADAPAIPGGADQAFERALAALREQTEATV